ncbi:tenascin-X-like isoform X4 [Notolabrus celidotus]|uniref:tenascin-X-like isoform X4 n=1 Tax=Notolabrus celidotus TaxID=1203425 RepID=UPI00148FB173|nr:tenascin-X-like isoform X4 [Notolabrus celidotus]
MTLLVRLSVSLLLLCALLKISEANCEENQCAAELLTVDTTSVTFESNPSCNLSIGNHTFEMGSIPNLISGAVHTIYINCLNCCTTVTTKPTAVANLNVNGATTSSMFLTWNKPEGKSSRYKVDWTDDGTTINTTNTPETSKSITDLTAGVQYNVSVTAVAEDNITEGEKATVSSYTKPEVVRNLTVINATTSSMFVDWTKPEGESSLYRVQWKTNNGEMKEDNVTETNINITDLTAGVQYEITVTAVVPGTDGKSITVSHFTKPEVVRNLTVINATTSSMFVDWTKPEGGSSLYRVQWKTNNGEMKEDNVTETNINITDLTAGVQYEITVTAVAEDGITDGKSTTVSQYTKPEVVRHLAVINATTSSMFVDWTKPEGGSSLYRVQWKTNNGEMKEDNVTETNINITDLTAGVQYEITVTAVVPGTDGKSITVSHFTKPEVVRNLTVINATTSSMFVDWTKPEGGSSLYRVQWKTNNGEMKEDNVTETNINITDLTAGVQYEITVTAVAEDGITDGKSTTVSQYTKPEVVRHLAVINATTSSMFVDWTKPEGGSSLYRVQWKTNNGEMKEDNVTETNINITDLTAGVQYEITVTAVVPGTDGKSITVSHFTKPEVVRNLTVINATTSSMFVDWTKPEGGSSLYRVQWKTNNGEMKEDNVTETNINITDLTAGVQYEITVTAVAEDGITDGKSTTVSQYTKPEVVRHLAVINATTSSMFVDWTKPEGGSSLYRVQWKTNNGEMKEDNVTETNINITDLTAGVQYEITVTAVVPGTDGKSITVSHFTKPEVVRNLTVINATTSSMFVDWTKPEGGSSLYRVQWKTNNGEMKEDNVTETNINITDLTAGVQYEITVTAVAEDGITDGKSTTVSQYTKPEVVRNLAVINATTSSMFVDWTKPEGGSSLYRVQWKTNNGEMKEDNVTETNINITDLTAGVQYEITVTAVVPGTDGKSITVSHFTKPEVVRNLTVINATTSSMFVDWTKPEGGSSLYRVQWKTNNGEMKEDNVTETNINITDLTAGVQYEITVTAVAEDGITDGKSTTVSQYTKPEVVRHLAVINATTSSMFVDWTKPEGGSSLYRVQWKTNNGEMKEDNVTETNINITDLTAGVQYEITVTAVAEDGITDGKSTIVSQYTKPEVVRHLAVINATTSSMFVDWTKPEGGSSLYRVQWKTNNGEMKEDNVTETNINITDLTAGVQYEITVTAVVPGTDGKSITVSHFTKPEVVRNLTVINATTSSMFVDWTKPEGGSSLYRVQWKTNNGEMKEDNVTETNINITDLTAGVQYEITVTAVAEDGITDGKSTTVSQYTKPEVVRNLTVINATTSSMFVDWTKPEGGSSLYRVQWKTNNGEMKEDNVTETNINITDLTAGVQYEITVTAVAEDGITDGKSTTVSQYTKPEVVRHLAVINATTSSMFVDWTKPEGGSSLYRVQWKTNNGEMKEDNVTETNINITDLTAGVQYEITVTAVAEDGITDGKSTIVSQYTKPEVVRHLAVINATTSSMFVDWTKPEGGSSLYRVQWKTNNGEMKEDNVTETNINITDLTAGVQYEITVTAVVPGTDGKSITVSHFTKPEVVRNLTVINATTSSMFVDWTKPEGGSSLYRVQWKTNNGEMKEDNVTETNINITDLTAGVQYEITVTAVAEDGITDGKSTTVSQYTKPEVVRNLAVINATTSSMFVDWTKPEGGSSLYRVQWKTNNGEMKEDNVTETNINITDLTAGVQYEITVTAVVPGTDGKSITVSHFTKPEVVRNLTVINATTSSMFVDWTKPEGGSSLYRVQWKTNNGEMKEDNVTETNINITDLTAGVQYEITVTAVAEDGITDGKSTTVSQYTKPEVVRHLAVINATTSSMFVDWTKPEGGSSLYRVQWKTNNGEMKEDNVTETNINITDLTAGVQYEITVTAVAEDGITDGKSTIVSQYTKPEVVRHLAVINATTSSMFVDWTKPEGGSSLYRVQWKTNNGEMKEDNVTETNINITDLTAGVQYEITVTAVVPGTDGKSITVSHFTKPEVVRNLTVINATTSSMFVDWTKPEGGSSLYRVQWKTNNGEMKEDNVTETNINITDLTAGVQYEITVTAVAEDGITDGKSTTVSQYTKPEVVRNLAVINATTSSMFVDWTKPEGGSSLYRVQWKTNNGEMKEDNVTETNINITDLTAGVQYEITVTAVVPGTDGKSITVSHFTKPEVVRNLTVINATTSSMFVDWTKPEGGSSLYRVQWKTNNGEMKEDNVTETNINITDLTAGVQYEITVTAVAEDGITDGKSTTVSQYTKPEVVRHLAVINATTSSMFVDWTKPEGGSSLYRVQWKTNNGEMKEDNVTETNINITDLTAGVQYEITVTAVAEDGITDGKSTIVSQYTKPEVVRHLAVINATTSSMFVDWTKPEGGSSLYRVQWKTNNGEMKEDNVTETNINITDLTAGVQYEITVTAVAEDGITDGKSTTVSQYTKPEVVRNLTVIHITTSSIFLEWTEPERKSSFFKVQWTNGTTKRSIIVTETKINVTQLTAGVQYHFAVIAVAGDNTTESEMAEISHYTKPEVVRNLTVIDVTTSSMSLTWTEPEGESSIYRVHWNNGGINETVNVTETHINITNLTAGVQYEITVTAVADDGITEGQSTTVSQYTKPRKVEHCNVSTNSSSISLSWTKPPDVVFKYRIDWHNGGTVKSIDPFFTSAVLSDLIPGTTYTIQIYTLNAANEIGDPYTFTSDTKPAVVKELTIVEVTTSSVSLKWTKPEGYVTSYIVQWTQGGKSGNNMTTKTSFNITELSPGSRCNITVFAVAEDPTNTGDRYSVFNTTRPKKPVNITVKEPHGTDNLEIDWILPDGRVDHYVVKILNEALHFSNSSTRTETSFHFTGLKPGRVFNITVTAVAGQFSQTSDQASFATAPTPPGPIVISDRTNSSLQIGWTAPTLMEDAPDISYHITCISPEDVEVLNKSTADYNAELSPLSSGTLYNISVQTVGPQKLKSSEVHIFTYTSPNPVLNLVSVPKSTTSVEVKWSEPLGLLDYYEYSVKAVSPTGKIINRTVSTDRFDVPNLEPGTGYNISVRTIAAPGIESTDEYTFSYTLPIAVSNLTVVNVTTTTIQLSWLRQSDHKSSYSYWVLAYQEAMLVKNDSTKDEMYTFLDLCPGSFYTFTVMPVVEGVMAAETHTSSHTWPAAVSIISVLGNTTSLSVSWTPAECQVDSYTVLLHENGEHEGSNSDLSNTSANRLFKNLKPGVQYCGEVVTKSGPFENKSSSVCNATFPTSPGPIMVDSQTVDSINFTWSSPEDMDHRQYNFSVSISKGSVLTANTWFVLENLKSGNLYNISVVTVGAMDYESEAATAENYTRPFPVNLLAEKTQITTNTVKIFWDQQERKSHYSYVVQVSNNAQAETVTITEKMISGLLSGSNYSFTVTTQTEDGTQATPVTVSYFTRPYGIRELKADTLNTTNIHLVWTEPLEYKPEYTFRVETADCGSHMNQTLTEKNTQISELTPGTKCTFCVAVRAADGIEGEANCTYQYTKPETVQPSISNQHSNSSVLVSWTKPAGRVEHYKVNLNSTNETHVGVLNSTTSFVFEDLNAGRIYSAMVITSSGPFNEPSGHVNVATLPNPPGQIEVLKKTTSSIHIKWDEAPLMHGASFFYQLMNITTQGGDNISAINTTHTFTSLLSGTSYNISVATVGALALQSERVQISMVTTRPFHVTSLVFSEDEKHIKIEWVQPQQYKKSYFFNVTLQSQDRLLSDITKDNKSSFDKLNPGSPYNISVTTQTADGTQGDPAQRATCTKASSVTNVICQSSNKTEAELFLNWDCPPGGYTGFQVSVDDVNTINQTYGHCNRTVPNLHHYTKYKITVVTQSCGQPSNPETIHCWTEISDPPAPKNDNSLVTIKETLHYKFSLQLNSSLLNNTNGPVTHVGVLVTEHNPDTSSFRDYLGKTYDEWKEEKTPAYLATVKEVDSPSRSGDTYINIDVGDKSVWKGYSNGVLQANGNYKFAIVLFTKLKLKLQNKLVNGAGSLVSTSQFSDNIHLPANTAMIGLAVGATLGIFCILFIVLVGFIIYWRRVSNKESPDIQIHSMRSNSAVVTVEDFEAHYRKQKADSNCGFAEEFEDLKVVGTGQLKTNALTLENKPKNRYNNVLPYDSSRVKLSVIHGSPCDDYINANYMPGYNSRKEFIAAQGPLPQTVNEFWRMIWEKNVQTLVMLTRCNEQGRVKCEQYWAPGTKHFENIIVTTTSEIPLKDWTIRDFDIKNVKTAETRTVRHFHFTAWPDHGVPETTELLISFRHLVREHMDQNPRNSPTVVHCSAGVGRTGTFIAIDHLIIQIERESVVDVYGIVYDLRMHRPLMVQTEDQYVFLNQCAMDIIRSRTGTNVDLIYQNTAALSIYENVDPKKGFPRNGYGNE